MIARCYRGRYIWKKHNIPTIPAELVIRHEYHPSSDLYCRTQQIHGLKTRNDCQDAVNLFRQEWRHATLFSNEKIGAASISIQPSLPLIWMVQSKQRRCQGVHESCHAQVQVRLLYILISPCWRGRPPWQERMPDRRLYPDLLFGMSNYSPLKPRSSHHISNQVGKNSSA
jgi:hypothetical protein